MAIREGTSGNDTLTGTGSSDEIYGYEGNDVIQGNGSDDLLDGGMGSDTYLVGTADGFNDYADSGSASDHDVIRVTADNVVIGISQNGSGLTSIEEIDADGYVGVRVEARDGQNNFWDFSHMTVDESVIIAPGDGNDEVRGSNGANVISGGDGRDLLSGRDGDDRLNGNDDQDDLYGEEGNDELYGGDHADFIDGGADDDYIVGGQGDDTLYGGTGNDTFYYHETFQAITQVGDDTIEDFNANETGERDQIVLSNYFDLRKGWFDLDTNRNGVLDSGDELVRIRDGSTEIDLNGSNKITVTGNTELTRDDFGFVNSSWGYASNDTLAGGGGDDTLYGGDGDDVLDAMGGNDILSGGTGLDIFRFSGFSFGHNIITDFTSGEDRLFIDMSTSGYTSFADLDSNGNDRLDAGDVLVSDNNGDLVLNLGPDSSITLQNTTDVSRTDVGFFIGDMGGSVNFADGANGFSPISVSFNEGALDASLPEWQDSYYYALGSMSAYGGASAALKVAGLSSAYAFAGWAAVDFAARVTGEILRRTGHEEEAAYFPSANVGIGSYNLTPEDIEEAIEFGDLGEFEWVEDVVEITATAALGTAWDAAYLGFARTGLEGLADFITLGAVQTMSGLLSMGVSDELATEVTCTATDCTWSDVVYQTSGESLELPEYDYVFALRPGAPSQFRDGYGPGKPGGGASDLNEVFIGFGYIDDAGAGNDYIDGRGNGGDGDDILVNGSTMYGARPRRHHHR